jgi:hypothetical protein
MQFSADPLSVLPPKADMCSQRGGYFKGNLTSGYDAALDQR